MTKEYTYQGFKWIDLENPTKEEINLIIHNFSVPIHVAEDLLSPTPKQRVLTYHGCVYLVLHFPTLSFHKNAFRGENHRKEIDFILGKDFLITVHYHTLTSIDKFSESIKEHNPDEAEGSASFFHKLVKNLYHYLLHDVETIKQSLADAEIAIFKGEEKRMVIELSSIHRDILRFNSALAPHKEAIETLRNALHSLVGDDSEMLIHDIKSEYDRVDRKMANNKALLDELRLTNDSLLSSKQNEAIKGLTMMAFITFPLTLIAAIFSMDTLYKPIIGQPNDFIIIIGIMLAVVLASVTFFNYKKWL